MRSPRHRPDLEKAIATDVAAAAGAINWLGLMLTDQACKCSEHVSQIIGSDESQTIIVLSVSFFTVFFPMHPNLGRWLHDISARPIASSTIVYLRGSQSQIVPWLLLCHCRHMNQRGGGMNKAWCIQLGCATWSSAEEAWIKWRLNSRLCS